MVLFGGTTSSLQPSGSIYILDIQNLSWTKGADIKSSLGRESMACTVAGDNFVAWGGDLDYEQHKSLGTPVIYNLKTNQWTNPATTSVGAVIGGTVAGVIVLVAIGFFGYKRYRSKRLRDSSLISTTVAMENIGDPNNIQPIIIVRSDALPPFEQRPVNERVDAPIQLGQSPHAILPSETDKYPKYKVEFVTPSEGNVNEQPLSNIISRNPQDRGEIAPILPLVARNPHVWQQYDVRLDPNAQLEAQIAQIQAQHNFLYQQEEETLRLQQQRRETLRLEQQAQMEMLRRQLIANKNDSNDG
ncbi:hypothetical protein BGX21_001912 [Mortierella sp. AD011]|nr:hypothetical protein BGX20_003699 [Mortierella sp. AD010]KAF9403616.1 hypothetical protein BGX21_001912 [Mortierella sp. AD011]